jgi:hypothetical protein
MTENPNLEQRLADLERRHDRTRALLVDALSATVIVSIGFYVRPEGWHAAILGFCGAFFIPGLIASLLLRDASAKGANPQKRKAPAPEAPWRYLDRDHRSPGNGKAAN